MKHPEKVLGSCCLLILGLGMMAVGFILWFLT